MSAHMLRIDEGLAAAVQPRQSRRVDPPGPAGLPLFGAALQFRHDPLAFLTRLVAEYGDVVRVPLMRVPLSPMQPQHQIHVVNHPDLVQQVCATHRANYEPHAQLVAKLKAALGIGDGELLTSCGAAWERRKRLLQPSFSKRQVSSFDERIGDSVLRLVRRWQRLPDGAVVDVDREMTDLVTRLFARLFAGLDLESEDAHLAPAWGLALDGIGRRMVAPWTLLGRLPLRANREFAHALRQVEQRLERSIRQHRDGSHLPDDFLARWIRASAAQPGADLDDSSLRDQLLMMLLAGRRNVANGVAWACHLLGRHPHVAQRLSAQVRSVAGDRPPSSRDLASLPLLTMVCSEVLRLYPAAWLIARRCVEDDVVGGYFIPRGTTVFMSPYTLHRHPSFWSDPQAFDPLRFARGGIEPAAFLPFGRGPRTCIGSVLAERVMQLVVATLAQHVVLRPISEHEPRIRAAATLRPRGGLPMVIERRTGAGT